jgi:hypothetical protein
MFIVLSGNPTAGFSAFGPYDDEAEAQAICTAVQNKYGGVDWFVFPLARTAPCPPPRRAQQWREADEAWIRFSAPALIASGSSPDLSIKTGRANRCCCCSLSSHPPSSISSLTRCARQKRSREFIVASLANGRRQFLRVEVCYG